MPISRNAVCSYARTLVAGLGFISILNLSGLAAPTQKTAAVERQAIFDVAISSAVSIARQPVQMQLDRFNIDRGWAVMVGRLASTPGHDMDWTLAEECNNDLDKMLWVVLKKSAKRWQVEQIDICASEPPYWYLEQNVGLVWPCGVYAGLEIAEGEALEDRCRERQAR